MCGVALPLTKGPSNVLLNSHLSHTHVKSNKISFQTDKVSSIQFPRFNKGEILTTCDTKQFSLNAHNTTSYSRQVGVKCRNYLIGGKMRS